MMCVLIFFVKAYIVGTHLYHLDKFIKAYVVDTHLNCLNFNSDEHPQHML